MKSMRNKIFTVIFSFALAIFVVASCEVGLGSSVDTEPPTLVINSPESASIIRGNFAIKGTWADDQDVAAVSCVLKNTDNEQLQYSFEGDVYEGDGGEGSWTVLISTASVADGTYEARVSVEDSAGHETVAVRQLVIDNTEPVVVLKRPSSSSGDAAADIDGYGQVFSLKGLAADDSGVGLIEVSIYSDEGLTNLLKTISIKNVPNTISLDVAQFEEGVKNDYSEIYGSTSRTAGEVKRWCKVTAYDGAQFYPSNGAAQSENDKKGNASTSYYLYEDLSKTILSEYKITELYAMKNGTYKGGERSVSDSIISSLDSKKINSGVFTLNPANNPYYTVSGYQELKKDGSDFGESMYVTNGNSLIISVKPGLDSYAVKEETLKVYVQQCNINGEATGDRILIDTATIEKSGTSYTISAPLSKANGLSIGKTYLLFVEGEDESPNPNPLVTKGKGYGFYLDANGSKPSLTVEEPRSTATVPFKASDSSVTISGKVYFPSETSEGGSILIKDSVNDNLMWPVSAGTSTGIFGTDEDKTWSIALNFGNSGENDSNGNPYLPDGEHKLIIYAFTGADFDNADSIVSVERNLKIDTKNPERPDLVKLNKESYPPADNDKWYNNQSLEVELNLQDQAWSSGLVRTDYYVNGSSSPSSLQTTTQSKASGFINGLDDGPNTVKFVSIDSVGNESEGAEYTFNVDTQEPEIARAYIANSSVTKNLSTDSVVNLQKEDESDKYKLYLEITEAHELASVTVKINGSSLGNINPEKDSATPGKWTWASNELTLATDTELPVIVEATDKAGKKETENYTILVDTKGPVITMTLPDPEKELTGEDSLKKDTVLKAEINDIAGNVAETKYIIRQTSFDDDEAAKASARAGTDWTLSGKRSVSAASGETEDFWYFYVYSKDEAENESIACRSFWLDKELPDLGITHSPNGTYNAENAVKTIVIDGTAIDTNGITKIEYSLNGGTSWVDTNFTGAWSINLPYGGTGTNPLADGDYTIYIRATDRAGRVKTENYSFTIDTEKPSISNFVISNTKKNDWYKDSELNVSVTVTDGRGVRDGDVIYSTDEDNTVLPLAYSGTSATGTITFEASGETKSISIAATDINGNKNTQTYPLKLDAVKPEVSGKFRQIGGEAIGNFTGTAFVNGSATPSIPVTLWGEFKDTLSGVDRLSLQIGTKTLSADITYYEAELPAASADIEDFEENNTALTAITDDNRKNIKAWKAVIQSSEFRSQSGNLIINGFDFAGNSSTANETAAIMSDEAAPIINKDTISITDNSETNAYRKSTSPLEYYVNNEEKTGKVFTIRGVSSDNESAVASTKLVISDGTTTKTYTSTSAASWTFEVNNLHEFTGTDATATITATDLAGNTKSETIKLNFDTTVPARTGTIKIDNENYTSGMWGIKSALSFNGNVTDSASGPAKVYFERFASNDLTTTPTSTGTITVSGSTFNGNVTGLLEGDNYIRLIAEDNVGNKETVTDATAIYYVKVDTKDPSLSSTSGGTKFTNGSTPVTVTGKCSDSGSGIESVTVSITFGSGNDAVTKTTPATIDKTKTPWEWRAEIPAADLSTDLSTIEDNKEYDIEATAKDVAGHTTTLTVAKLKGDKNAPTATLNSIVQSVVDSEGKYLVKPGTALTVKGLTEDTLSPSVKTWLKLVPYTSTASASEIEISKDTPATNPSWTLSISGDKLSSEEGVKGAKLFVCTKDLAGNINVSEKADLVFDEAGPVYKDSSDNSNFVATTVAGRPYSSEAYYNSESLIITGTWEDKAGVTEVTYELTVPGSPTPLKGSFSVTGKGNGLYAFNAEIRDFASGENQLKLNARDALGNETSISKDFTIKVDTTAPTASEYSADYGFNKNHLANGKNNITLYFYANDEAGGSGIDREFAPVITLGKNELTGTDSSAVYASDITEGKGYLVTVTLDKDDFESGYQPVVVTIKDKAGNDSRINLGSVDIDKDPPVVVLKAPADADIETDVTEVNGTITIKGTATDKNLKDAPLTAVEYYDSAASEWKDLSTISDALTITKNEGDFEFTLDTTKLSGANKIRVKAEDNGENEGISNEIEFTVDQETDRPVITFMDISVPAIAADSTSTDPVILKLVNSRKLRVTVSDDDGLAENGFIINQLTADKTTGEISRTPLTATSSRNGTYVYELPDTITDGIQDLEFIVIDTETSVAADRTFTSGTAKAPKLTDGTNKMNKATAAVKLMMDNVAPVSSGTQYAYYQGTYPASPAWAAAVPALGGSREKLAIKIEAADENKIASVSATIEGVSTSGVRQKRIVTVDGESKEVDDELNDGKYYSTWIIKDIDLSEDAIQEGGKYKLELTITDGASNTKTDSVQLSIDRTPPVLSILSPRPVSGDNTTYSAGSIKANGTISGASTLRYVVTATNTPPADSDYSDPIDFSTSWAIDFDGDTSATSGAHTKLLNTYLIDLGLTTQSDLDKTDNPYSTITPLYLWLKAEDEVGNSKVGDGNSNEETPFLILVNPQGGRPTIHISKPQNDGQLFGNEIAIYGTHQDTIGDSADKIGVKSAWVQIISEAHWTKDSTTKKYEIEDNSTGWGSTTKDSEGKYNITKNDLDYLAGITDASNRPVYEIYNMKTYKGDGTDVPYTAGSSISTANDYAILAKISGASWNLTLNSQGEFNPNSTQKNKPADDPNKGKNRIAIQVYAKDGDNSLNTVIENKYIFFDSDTPRIENLTLEQYDSSGKLISTRPYQPDMYISYRNNTSWKLSGNVRDEDGIVSYSMSDYQRPNDSENGIENTDKVKYFLYPLTKSGIVGTISFKITASDAVPNTGEENISIRFDDQAPELTTSGSDYNFNPIIRQDNGFYKFGSVAKEEPVNNTSQSGFAYTAFYFMRGNKLYDILKPKASSTLSANASATDSGFTYDENDHLYWYTKTVKARAADINVLTIDSSSDMTGIHENGLVKIDGTYYKITGTTSNTFTIDGTPEKSTTTVYVAAAALIDNEAKEKAKDGITPDITDGYYKTSDLEQDDGDRMVEYVYKSGTSWKWEASVSSKNIADGPVKLIYVVFDQAGNFVPQSADGIICNNTPRMAGFSVYTDYNNNGRVDDTGKDGKYEAYRASTYSANSVTGRTGTAPNTKDVYDPDAKSSVTNQKNPLNNKIVAYTEDPDDEAARLPVLTLRGKTKIIPEIVGGNGDVVYDYSITTSKGTTEGSGVRLFTGSTDYTINSKAINLQLGDLVSIGDVNCTEFKFTFRDSLSEDYTLTAEQKEKVYAYLSVYMGIATTVSNPPKVEINPFYWNSIQDNSIFGTKNANTTYKDLKGHIELEEDWTKVKTAATETTPAVYYSGYDGTTSGEYDADPKVSGQIVVTGTVHDDNLISKIHVKYGSFIDKDVATFASGALTATSDATGTGYEFILGHETFSATGHDVEWTLNLNTETVGGTTIAAADVELTVTATNLGTPDFTNKISDAVESDDEEILNIAGNKKYGDPSYSSKSNTPGSTNTSKTAKKAYYRMDIVPYITGVTTKLSANSTTTPSIYDRTALGHYPVYAVKGEASNESVTITGFNLKDGTVKFTGAAATDNPSVGTTTTVNAKSGATSYRGITIPASAKSGIVSIDVSGIESLNNINNDNSRGDYGYEYAADGSRTDSLDEIDAQGNYNDYSNFYNRIPNNKNNNILTDNVHFDIWDFNPEAALAVNNGKVDNLEMKINPQTGMLGFVFSNGSVRLSIPNGTTNSYQFWDLGFDYISHNALCYDENGYAYAIAVGGDISAADNRSCDVMDLYSNQWGVVYRAGTNTSTGQYSHKQQTNHMRRLDQIGQKGDKNGSGNDIRVDKDRLQSQSLVTHPNNTNASQTDIYLAYYDLLNEEIRFKAGTLANPAATTASDFGNFVNRDAGGQVYSHSANYCQIIADGTTDTFGKAGSSVALGVTSDNTVVIAWFDGTKLHYAYTTTPLAKATTNTKPIRVNTNNNGTGWEDLSANFAEYTNIGQDCKIAVDSDNHIHIAAYDVAKENLVYFYLESYNSTPIKSVVDAYGTVGSNITIDVAKVGDNQIPYIGYWGAFPAKPRHAYLANPAKFHAATDAVVNGVEGNYFTGVWECSIVPTKSNVKDKRKINVGVWKYTKDADGKLTNKGKLAYSRVGANNVFGTVSGEVKYTDSTAEAGVNNGGATGICYGNGSNNAVLAYVVTLSGSKSNAETAQMR